MRSRSQRSGSRAEDSGWAACVDIETEAWWGDRAPKKPFCPGLPVWAQTGMGKVAAHKESVCWVRVESAAL